jgi:hypothetical protein
MIERVAHRVRERIFNGFEKALIELSFLAFDLSAHAAAKHLRKVADDARHF